MTRQQGDKEANSAAQLRDAQAKKRARRLSQALCVSVLLNITLFFFCAYESQEMGYFLLRKSHYKPSTHLPSLPFSDKNGTLEEALLSLSAKTTPELLVLLEDETLLVDGYKVRDLALGLLASSRHFNMQKALPGNLSPQQARVIHLADTEIKLFPGLASEQVTTLLRYVKEERYPFTAEGLFCELTLTPQEIELKEAFSHTQEYVLVETLLSRAGQVTRDDVLDLLHAGDWKLLREFADSELQAQDFSPEKRQQFLLAYLACSSKKAAEFLFTFDREFTLHKLDDAQVITLLSLLEGAPLLHQDCALTLLESERSDDVWHAAQGELVKLSKQEELVAFSRGEVLAHFGRKVPVSEKVIATAPLSKKQEGKAPGKKPQSVKADAKLTPATKAGSVPKSQPKKTTATKPSQNKSSTGTTTSKTTSSKIPPKAIAKVSPKQTTPKKAARQIIYVVQNGDNLWRISKKFQVDVALIRQANNLQSDALKPGLALRIPN
jgi:LysM repeat protein